MLAARTLPTMPALSSDVFAESRKRRDDAYAETDTRAAEEGVADAERQSQRMANVLSRLSQRRETGGGRYSSIGSSRRGIRLGGLTSGLGAANRAALTAARRKEADSKMASSRRANLMANFGWGAEAADKAMSSEGYRTTMNLPAGGTRTQVQKVDDAGNIRTSWL